jgi:hypothetical protein
MFRDTYDVIVNHAAVYRDRRKSFGPGTEFLVFVVLWEALRKKIRRKKDHRRSCILWVERFFSFLLISKTESRSQSVYCDYRATQGYNILYSHSKYIVSKLYTWCLVNVYTHRRHHHIATPLVYALIYITHATRTEISLLEI